MLWTPERKALALAACEHWAGTPHKNRVKVEGEGVDCIHFVFEVLIAAGIVERFPIVFYDERLGFLRERNLIEDILTKYLHGESVAPEPEFGDLVIFRCGAQSNHIGIYVGDAVWHVAGGRRVGPDGWERIKRRSLQSLVRLTAPGFREDPTALTWEDIIAIPNV